MLFLSLLFIKHYIIDFRMQTKEMIQFKGVYGDPVGLSHSLMHGAGTMAIALLFTGIFGALFLGALDSLFHYHIDWLKSNYGSKDPSSPEFWSDLGLDQLAHYLTYLLIVSL